MRKAGGGAEIDATRPGAVGVKKRDAAERTARLRTWGWNDQIPELVGKVGGGNAKAVGIEVLVKPRADCSAALRAEVGISRAAGIRIEGFERGGLFDSLTVGGPQSCVTQKGFGVAQSEHASSARHNPSAKAGVCFCAASGGQSQARDGRPATIEEAALIVAVGVTVGVLYFILIATRDRAAAERMSGLREAPGAVGLIHKIREWREAAADAVVAGLHGGKMMAPVLARLEVPREARGKLLEVVESRGRIGKVRAEQRLAGSASEAGIAANAQT